MPFIGNQLSTSFQNVETQTITGDGSTGYTLNNAVADGKDLLVYINNVKQEEGSGKSYTATGTTITFTEAVASTDSCYVVFIGQAVGTVTPKDGSIVSSMLADANLEMPNTLDLNGKELILDADADTSITADTDDTIDIKIAGSDVYQITATKVDLNGKELVLDADADTSITADTDDRIDFKTGGTDRMHLVTEKLGLGTSSPGEILHLKTTADADLGLKVENDDSQAFVKVQSGGTSLFGGNAGVNFVSGGSFATAMHINSSQNVGIGTLSPTARLHTEVSRTTNFSASDYTTWADVLVRNNTNDDTCATGIGFITDGENYTNGAGGIAAISGSGDTEMGLAFITRPNGIVATEQMRILSNGVFVINKTADDTSTPGVTLSRGGSAFIRDGGGLVSFNRQTSDGVILTFQKDGSSVGTISTNANSLPSDKNFKKDIKDLNIGLDLVSQLEPKSFNTIVDDEGSPVMYGLIAQDVEVALEKVGVTKNSAWLLQHEEIDDAKQSDYSLDYGKLIPILINAIKELQTKVTALEAK